MWNEFIIALECGDWFTAIISGLFILAGAAVVIVFFAWPVLWLLWHWGRDAIRFLRQ